MSDLDQLRSLGDQVVPPSFELLRETARRRDRRHSVAAALASAAAVVVVVVGIALLADSDGERTAPPPADSPGPSVTTRPLTYADGVTIYYGEQTLDAPGPVQELDVTDAGVVARTADGGIWFTDGQDLERVGTLGEPGSAYADADHPFGASWGFVVSDNTGARAAWLEFPQPGEPELVVYDTENAEESAREPLGVDPGSYALLAGVTDRYGYWYSNPESIEDEPYPDQRIDLGSGATEEVSVEAYAADRPGPNSPRTMMVSHAEESEPADYRVIHDATMRQFDVRAGRLVPMGMQPMDARDGGTGRRFEFEAPEGYPNGGPGWLVQWLDDDTVVVVQTRGGNDDLLECRHSTGACTLAEQLPEAAVLPEAN